MTKWEYKYIERELKWKMNGPVKWEELDELWNTTNEWGKEGWELVSTTPVANPGGWTRYLLLVFKKPIEN